MTKSKMDFPTTDEEVRYFLESNPPVQVPQKYETLDWLFEEILTPN